jgi:LmbE family N-acetylglucosaminyl deacetylase
MRVLCVGAHCDDIEVSCGGTILHHVNRGDRVISLVMTGHSTIREQETMEAGKILGISEVNVNDFMDTHVPSGFDAIKVIEEAINRIVPDRVYTHTTKDTHQDHRNTGLATLSAARKIPQILFYQSAPPKSWAFNPNYYVDISKYMDQKIDAIKLFKSQSDKWYMKPDVLRSMAAFRGVEIGATYAEAFEVYKFLEV